MDVRIGVTDHPREIAVKLAGDTDRAAVKAQIEAALAGSADTLWLTDEKGGEVGIPSARIAFAEIGPEGGSPIGFG
ncbi:MAG: DUF3107 domain-containing protein [Acidimicrobiales bacterium]|nr:DUF3107 domain-containing protein [Acidimicrobiales bacterium]